MQSPQRLEIFIDGACAFCEWIRRKIEPFDRMHLLSFLDYHQPETLKLAAPLTAADLSKEIYVRDEQGDWNRGFFAWTRILSVLPRLRWIAWLFSAPPCRWLGPPVYRSIARNRYRLWPGMPRPCEQICDWEKDKKPI